VGEWRDPTWSGRIKLDIEEICESSQGVFAGQEGKGVGGTFGVLGLAFFLVFWSLDSRGWIASHSLAGGMYVAIKIIF